MSDSSSRGGGSQADHNGGTEAGIGPVRMSPPARSARRLRQVVGYWLLAGFLLLLALLPLWMSPTSGWDIWWHLATGREMLATGTWLPTDPFSFSHAGHPWVHKDWLADLLLWCGFARLGFIWFALLKAASILGLGAALLLVVPRAHRRNPWLWLLLGLGLLAVRIWVIERPVLFSLVAFPLLAALLERARWTPAPAGLRILLSSWGPVVLVQVAWGMLHRGALLGFVLQLTTLACGLAAAAGRLRTAPCPTRPPSGWTLLWGPRPTGAWLIAAALALLLSIALTLLHPSGLAFFVSGVGVAGSALLREYISEWARLEPGELLTQFPGTVLLAGGAFVAWAARIAVAWRQRGQATDLPPVQLHHGLWLLLLAGLALDSVRWLPLLASWSLLVLAPIVTELSWAAAVGRIARRPHLPGPEGAANRAPARLRAVRQFLLVSALGLGLTAHLLVPPPLALGEAPDRYPAGALAFLAAQGLRGPLVNAFSLGGYVIFHGHPHGLQVLVDGRNETVYPPAFLVDALEAQTDPARFASMRRQDGATLVLASNRPGHVTHHFLAGDPDWLLVYWSEAAVVYAKAAAHPELARWRYRLLDPVAVDLSVVHVLRQAEAKQHPELREELAAELARLEQDSPGSLRAGCGRAIFLHFSGPTAWAERNRELLRLEELHPGAPALAELRARFANQVSEQ